MTDVGLAEADPAFNLTWHDWLNMRSLIEMSQVIAKTALQRENSRGAHYRDDFPDTGSLVNSHFTIARKADEQIAVTEERVYFTRIRPGESLLQAGAGDGGGADATKAAE